MRKSKLALLRCPGCKSCLAFEAGAKNISEAVEGQLLCSCGNTFPVRNGVPDLTFPADMGRSDQELRTRYDCSAAHYETGLKWLFRSFYEDADALRSEMVDLLGIGPDATVLDLGCGTGEDSIHIVRRLDHRGSLFMLDLAAGMLELSRQKLSDSEASVEWLQGNGCYLPFADNAFDAVFHFGGINEFSEPRRALNEMTRVTRVCGKVVVGDEGVAPWLRRKTYGRILTKANPLYKNRPPLECLPANARDVRLRWILGNAFYVIDYKVGEGPPPVDLDLPIPGRGDTLRSRYSEPNGG